MTRTLAWCFALVAGAFILMAALCGIEVIQLANNPTASSGRPGELLLIGTVALGASTIAQAAARRLFRTNNPGDRNG